MKRALPLLGSLYMKNLDTQIESKFEDVSQPLPYKDSYFDYAYARLVLHYLPKKALDKRSNYSWPSKTKPVSTYDTLHVPYLLSKTDRSNTFTTPSLFTSAIATVVA